MITFASPIVLAALAVLPIIWWLLKFTPPRPQTEIFPPLKILAKVLRKDESPDKSPWWLTLLRLALAGLLILALARPVLNPRNETQSAQGRQLLLIDNSWASVFDWEARVATATSLIEAAADRNEPVILAFSAMPANADIGPFEASTALEKLAAAKPEPVPGDRALAMNRINSALGQTDNATLALLSDGLAASTLPTPPETISTVQLYTPETRSALALIGSNNGSDSLDITAARDPSRVNEETFSLSAYDSRQRPIGKAELQFKPGEELGVAQFILPFEVRNDISTVSIDGVTSAGSIQLFDAGSGRRRVALIAASNNDGAQPLLAPLYYIREALAPFADLVEPTGDNLDTIIDAALGDRPAVMVLADVGAISTEARSKLTQWVKKGGALIRFAGPRLGASEPVIDDQLLPAVLRTGERALDGAMSWGEPQAIAAFPENSPFFGLPAPRDVLVRRQVLADPSLYQPERTWAVLNDGTPLVTGTRLDRGIVALFHVSPDATWSNLPISGTFVEMLRRTVQLASSSATNPTEKAAALPPLRVMNAEGRLNPPPATAEPAATGSMISFHNPPGFYGSNEAVVARNLFDPQTRFAPFELGSDWKNITRAAYITSDERDLRGPLFGLALVLVALDAIAVLWMAGAFSQMKRRWINAAALFLAAAISLPIPDSFAQKVSETEAIDAVSQTRIAYVETGNAAIDEVTKAGLEGLGMFISSRTALEPGEPKAVDPAVDELAFFPVIYWPIDPGSAMPSASALSNIDAYMKDGGTVLFDTRDELQSGFDAASASASTLRLRDMLASMNVPALEPVPTDHVLTKAFFILQDFPGRYRGGPLWVEASSRTDSDPVRPVRALDGVTPIMITGNDMAAAWAADEFGDPLYATVPNDPDQRLYAYRAGVNIMMYALTGNYKSDQVHIPALLERLGQ